MRILKEFNVYQNKQTIKKYLKPSTVFVRNSFKYDNYEIIKGKKFRGDYIIRGNNAQSNFDILDYFENAKCFDDLDVFNSVLQLGSKLVVELHDNLIKYQYDSSIFNIMNPSYIFFWKLLPEDVKKITPIILEWVEDNGLPFQYIIDSDAKWGELGLESFVDIILSIYIIFTIVYLLKEKYANLFLPEKQEEQLNYLQPLLKSKLGLYFSINGILGWISRIEQHFAEINFSFNEEFEIYKTADEHTEYRLIKYYNNILGVAWHKMKLLLCQNQEVRQTFIRCSECGNVAEATNLNQKYCLDCQDIKKREKSNNKYYKILNIHKQLVDEYYRKNIYDAEILKIVQLTKHSEIKEHGVQKLEKLLLKLHSL